MFQFHIKKKKFKMNKNQKKELRDRVFNHPHPEVQRRCLAVLLLTFLFCASLVALILGLTPTTVRNYWNIYKKGGIQNLEKLKYKKKKSALDPYAKSIEEEFNNRPPSSIGEASARIKSITGIERSTKAVRLFLKRLNFRYRKVAGIPAKADHQKQKEFLNEKLEPLLNQAKKGLGIVLFVDAAHFVHGAFLGCLWSIKRVFIKTPSGRKRFNVLGAVNAITKQLHMVCNETYISGASVCTLLKKVSLCYRGKPITIVLDNARYQRCDRVIKMAKKLKIELLFLPPYSPNLNLIERLWKLVKKKALNSRYYETFSEFRGAIKKSLKKFEGEWKQELNQLLTLRFQLFPQGEKDNAA